MNYKPRITIRNTIADSGLAELSTAGFAHQAEFDNCDAILVRSEVLDIKSIPPTCQAIARAGVGVNNIPIDMLTERGVVVFNTPGANANSVKELVVAGLLLCSRPIITAAQWATAAVKEYARTEVDSTGMNNIIEAHKKQFIGSEIAGKTLGVIGLGAVGVQVSNTAASLGMKVLGYDPYITVSAAWGLSSKIQHVDKLEQLFARSNYITIHVPLNSHTMHMINAKILRHAKPDICILNFARGELVDNAAMLDALQRKKARIFMTDFPATDLLQHDAVILMPHLGASTVEAEQNCARMAAMQLVDFLQNGNIANSVNFPNCTAERSTPYRITIINQNVPSVMGKITSTLAAEKVNIQDFTNRHKEHMAYNIIDIDVEIRPHLLNTIKNIDGIVAVRAMPHAS